MNSLPSIKGFVSRPMAERFWEKVDQRGPDECWGWTGSTRKPPGNYGHFYMAGRTRPAAQVSWEIEHGEPFPAGMDACHTCDNPPCVNPAHIFPGTPSDNALDAKAKGRLRNAMSDKTHCKNGHEFTPENTRYYYGKGKNARICKACNRERLARRRARAVLSDPTTPEADRGE